jgi:hypothetical protein
MTDFIIDGRSIGRQQLLQLLRDVCASAGTLCSDAAVGPALWQDRAKGAIRSCSMLQRGLVNSHPRLADELHILATEIQIALAAQSHQPLFVERVQKVRDAILRVQQTSIDTGRQDDPGAAGS